MMKRMMKRNKKSAVAWLALAGLLALLTGCFYEELSWSPDGRYLAFATAARGAFWRWDAASHTTEKIDLADKKFEGDVPVNDQVKSCRYLPSGDQIMFLTEAEKEARIYVLDLKAKRCTRIAEHAGLFFDVSRAGKIYYLAEDEEQTSHGQEKKAWLYEYDNGLNKKILPDTQDIGFIKVDPSGTRLVYVTKEGIDLFQFNLDTHTTQTLITRAKTAQGHEFYWPTWLDEKHLLVLEKTEKNHGVLAEYDLDSKTSRSLAANVTLSHPPSIAPDGRTVAVVIEPAKGGESDADQVAAINLASGQITWLTNDVFGAMAPSYSPDGKYLAYLQPLFSSDDDLMLKILDLKTGRTEIAWRDDEERIFASAESLVRAGEPAQALAALQDLTTRYPKTRLLMTARYRMMRLYLNPPLLDLDKAWGIWKEFETAEMPESIARLFWRAEDRVATDPARDWITKFGTEASRKEFKFDTDLARDLRGLWVRAGKEKLYVKVDYGDTSTIDLSGITLQETRLLFKDAAARDTTPTQIGPRAVWDRTATRQVLIRHWFEGGESSQYDVEIRGAQGEVIHRFLASGFAPPKDPLFDRMATVPGETPGAVYAISRKTLGLEGKHKFGIQVVTLKGGIDPRGKLELPPTTGCGVADAFGAENAPEKVKAEGKTQGGEGSGRAPCVIKGYAAELEVE